jgi:hypothetical protein
MIEVVRQPAAAFRLYRLRDRLYLRALCVSVTVGAKFLFLYLFFVASGNF